MRALHLELSKILWFGRRFHSLPDDNIFDKTILKVSIGNKLKVNNGKKPNAGVKMHLNLDHTIYNHGKFCEDLLLFCYCINPWQNN